MGLSGASAYSSTETTTGVENADRHRLIQMMIDGAIEKINRAKFFLETDNIAGRGEHVSWAISIINGLSSSLDLERGGELAENLDKLYQFAIVTLLEANVQASHEKLDSVLGVLNTIKAGWDGIRQEAIEMDHL